MGWRLVYYNGRDMIYVSDTPEHKELIARYAYRYLRPETVDAAAFRDHRAELRAEVARMIAGDPDSPSAHDAAAWVYARIGDPLGAERELQIEARLLRNPAPALLGLGQLYAEWGESARALDCFRRAARLSPRDAMVHRALADLYQSEGRFREAVAERRRVIGLEPSGSRGRFDLARTYRAQALQSGDADERLLRKAIAELRTALRVDPQAAIAYALGSVYLDLDEPRPAILAFKQGIALDRTLPANYRGLAVAQEGVGDRQAAIEAWRDVLTHAPDPETAALARERLRVLSGS
jgi:tetratricopeptide (TPR) repeat protein